MNDDVSLNQNNAEDADLTTSLKEMAKFKKRISLPVYFISIALAVVLSVCSVYLIYRSSNVNNISVKLAEIDALVSEYYTGELDYDAIDDAVLSGYMKAIDDKYSFYKSNEDAEAVSNSFEGSTSGIGVTVYYEDKQDALAVFRVDKDSPAYKAGIKIGDLIVSVDGKTVKDIGYSESVEAIKRELGQTATLKISRDGKSIKATVLYEEFVKQSVYTEQYGDIGYLCFTNFNDATVAQFDQAMDDFEEAGIKGIVFDVRDNGGGTVDSVCEILDRLVGECDLMTVEYANGEKKVTHTSDKNETDLPMAVLVNGNTASASELFAATLRDQKNAKLIGNKTYGKGVVQRTYFLEDGSCVRFTVGKFYPSDGVCYNEIGLVPDYEVSFTDEQLKKQYVLGGEDPYLKKAIKSLG